MRRVNDKGVGRFGRRLWYRGGLREGGREGGSVSECMEKSCSLSTTSRPLTFVMDVLRLL